MRPTIQSSILKVCAALLRIVAPELEVVGEQMPTGAALMVLGSCPWRVLSSGCNMKHGIVNWGPTLDLSVIDTLLAADNSQKNVVQASLTV